MAHLLHAQALAMSFRPPWKLLPFWAPPHLNLVIFEQSLALGHNKKYA